MTPDAVKRVNPRRLQRFVSAAFQQVGVPRDEADLAATILVDADLHGIDSHGVLNLHGTYIKGIQTGSINPKPAITIAQGSPTTVSVDGDKGLGMLVGDRAMRECIRMAGQYVTGWATACYSIHSGAGAYYVRMAAAQDMIRMHCSTGGSTVARPRRQRSTDRQQRHRACGRKVKGKPEEEIVHYMVLRSLKQARYSPINVGHFGLASKCYAHFTSPIRRYPDLIVHRILREVLQKNHLPDKRIQELQQLLPDMAYHSSRMERHADRAENEVIDAMRAWFMKNRVGEEFDARIVSITPYGLKVRLKDFYVDGFFHVSYLTDDFYQFDERHLKLVGRNTRRSYGIASSPGHGASSRPGISRWNFTQNTVRPAWPLLSAPEYYAEEAAEYRRVLGAGRVRGVDLWHLACALYLKDRLGSLAFATLDRTQRPLAAASGLDTKF